MKDAEDRKLNPVKVQRELEAANAVKYASIVEAWRAVERVRESKNREAYYVALDRYLAL